MNGTVGAWLALAGWTMAPLVVCSVALVGVLLELVWRYHRAGVGSRGVLDRWPEGGGLPQLADLGDRGPVVDRVLGAALAAPPSERAEEGLRQSDRCLEGLERPLIWLSLLAQIAPLFGLLGTVIGMIDLFGAMESARGVTTAAVLAGGIWKALLTTAAGMSIAIVALVGHTWATWRLSWLRSNLEEGLGRVVSGRSG